MARTKVVMSIVSKAGLFLILATAIMVSSPLKAEEFNVSALASSALSWDCLDWKIDGVCVFLRCGLFGCYIVTTPRISHRLPDLVVQSYANTANPPWQEWQPVAKAAAQAASSALQGLFSTQLTGGAGSGIRTASLHRPAAILRNRRSWQSYRKGSQIRQISMPKRCVADETVLRVRDGRPRLAKRNWRTQKKGVRHSGTS